jgi:hypothetical protein
VGQEEGQVLMELIYHFIGVTLRLFTDSVVKGIGMGIGALVAWHWFHP